MARGSEPAQNAATSSYANAASLYGPLSTQLMSDVAHPAGINPVDLARMDTAALQTGGGSNGSAVGQGALRSARTRNAGGADAAIASAARTGAETASGGILRNRLASSELANQQRERALSGLNSLFAENLGGGTNAVNADVNAKNASWDWAKDLVVPLATGAMGTKRVGG